MNVDETKTHTQSHIYTSIGPKSITKTITCLDEWENLCERFVQLNIRFFLFYESLICILKSGV